MAVFRTHDWEIEDEITMGEELGRGSYGRVCVGEWKGAKVAVKMLHDIFREAGIPAADLAEFLRKFSDEWEIMKSLRHPNILQLFGVSNPTGGWPKMIMELMEESLEHRLNRGPLSRHTQLLVLRGIACGLRYLHERTRPIVHRDLASKNILLSNNASLVKIGDLGVATALTNLHSTRGTVMPGTELYMPPEVRSGVPPRPSLDMFSFGVIMIEAIVGRLPSPLPLLARDPKDPYKYRVLSEIERRKGDLSDIPIENRLHPVIIESLSILPEDRPTASQAFSVVSLMILSSNNDESSKRISSGGQLSGKQDSEEIDRLRADLVRRCTELEESRREVEESRREAQDCRREAQESRREVRREIDGLMGEKRSVEAELIEKRAAVAQLQDRVSSKNDELVHLRRRNRLIGIRWKSSSFEMPQATEAVMAIDDKHLLIADRGSGKLFLYDVNSYRHIGTRIFPYEHWQFDGLAVHCGKIYANLYDVELYQLGLYSYDLSTDSWNELFKKPNHDIAISGMTIAYNKVFIVGGRNYRHVRTGIPSACSRSVCFYDLISHTWVKVPTTQGLTARSYPSCVVWDNKLLIGGGDTCNAEHPHGFEYPSKVEVVSLETGQCVSNHAVKCAYASLAADETGIVIATGGLTLSAGKPKVETTVELYDPRSPSQWIPLPSLPRPRYAHASSIVPDPEISLILAGGQNSLFETVPWIDVI